MGQNVRKCCLSLMLLLGVVGCDIPERPKVITISKPPVFKPASPEAIHNVEQAMATIVMVCSESLGLPVVDPLYVHLYKNTTSFAFYGHSWSTLPFDVGNRPAFAEQNQIHINLEKIPQATSGTLLWLLAHEYGHNIHYAIGGREPRTSRWVTEGFADWVAAKVFDSLKWQSYEVTFHRALHELIRYHDILPEIASLTTGRDWESFLSKPKGLIRTYSQAFVAVDRLIRSNGLSATIQYLGSANFVGTFGSSKKEFLVDVEKYLLERKGSKRVAFTIEKPDWRIGYKWVYAKKSPGSNTKSVREVIGENTFQGTPSFVVREGEVDNFYAKESFGLMAVKKHGTLLIDVSRPEQLFSWPLEASKEWRNSFTRRNLEQKTNRNFDRIMFVAGVEQVTVAAGNFEAVKMEAYGFSGGRLLAEYWYSPKVKWFVKTRVYSEDEGLIEEELLRTDTIKFPG